MIRGPVFIIGCGRSGTHLLAELLESDDTAVYVEKPPQFPWSLAMARNTARREDLYPMLYEEYRKLLRETEGKMFIDKSQPNIWIAERLADDFPTAKFLGIERDCFGVVASTLNHGGFALNVGFSLSFSMPCPFFGIYNYEWYDLPLEQMYTLRWMAHEREMKRLRDRIPMLTISYEGLVVHPREVMDEVESFIDAKLNPMKQIVVTDEPLNRWKERLSSRQIALIAEQLEKGLP